MTSKETDAMWRTRSELPEALRLADAVDNCGLIVDDELRDQMADELRRLHAVNTELLEALKLALSAHGKILLSDPPQEAWKAYGVEAKARAAMAKATGEQA